MKKQEEKEGLYLKKVQEKTPWEGENPASP